MFHCAWWPGVILWLLLWMCFLFCYTLLSCEFFFFLCVLCCLMFIDMFHIQMQLILRWDQWNEYAWMHVCKYRRLVFSFGRSKWELYFNGPIKIVVFSTCSQASFPWQEADTWHSCVVIKNAIYLKNEYVCGCYYCTVMEWGLPYEDNTKDRYLTPLTCSY